MSPKDFTKCVTVAEVQQTAGYRTMMVGKWQGRDSALDRGFDRFYGPMCQGKVSYFHEVAHNPFFLDRKRLSLPNDFYMTSGFNDSAISFLKEAVQEEVPFFLYVAHLAPHWPLHAPKGKDVTPYRRRYLETGWDEWRSRRHDWQHKRTGSSPAIGNSLPVHQACEIGKTEKHKNWQAEQWRFMRACETIDRGMEEILKIVESPGRNKAHAVHVSLWTMGKVQRRIEPDQQRIRIWIGGKEQ